MSWKPEVEVQGEWSTNMLRFETEDEAQAYARDLYSRWTLCTDHRAQECTDPVTHRWVNETRMLENIKSGDTHSPPVRVQL